MLFLFAYTYMHRPSHTHTHTHRPSHTQLLSTLRMCVRAVKRCYRRLRGALFLQHFWEANDDSEAANDDDVDGQLAAGSPKWHHLSQLCSLSLPLLLSSCEAIDRLCQKGTRHGVWGNCAKHTTRANGETKKKGIGATLSVVCVFFLFLLLFLLSCNCRLHLSSRRLPACTVSSPLPL